jgi:hypothetical protein
MFSSHRSREGEVSMEGMLSVLKQFKASDLLGIAGKLLGIGLFGALMYTYCNVLIETCFRGVH